MGRSEILDRGDLIRQKKERELQSTPPPVCVSQVERYLVDVGKLGRKWDGMAWKPLVEILQNIVPSTSPRTPEGKPVCDKTLAIRRFEIIIKVQFHAPFRTR